MEIEKNQAVHIDAYVNQVRDKNKTGSADGKSEKTPVKTDTVVISEAAKRIQGIRKQLDAVPDIREDKVAYLKKQIQNGTYEIKADKIADKLVRESLINDGLK